MNAIKNEYLKYGLPFLYELKGQALLEVNDNPLSHKALRDYKRIVKAIRAKLRGKR